MVIITFRILEIFGKTSEDDIRYQVADVKCYALALNQPAGFVAENWLQMTRFGPWYNENGACLVIQCFSRPTDGRVRRRPVRLRSNRRCALVMYARSIVSTVLMCPSVSS